MNTTVKNTLTLTIITVIAGFFLGFVYDLTKDPIAYQKELAKQNAYKSVFSEASDFVDEGIMSKYDPAALANAGFAAQTVDEALVAKDSSGNSIGYVFTLSTSEGYGGNITLSMGVDNTGCLKGIEILSISETAGLGMKANTDEFKSQFANKNVTQFVYTKNGASADYEIDALSGATITTKAMTNAVNAGLEFYKEIGGDTDAQ